MDETKTTVTEASVKDFEEKIQDTEAKVKVAEEKYLKRLVQEAKDAGVDFKEDRELIEIGEKGIMKLIEQAKKISETKTVEETKTIKETKGETTAEVKEFSPKWRSGPIRVFENEMWSEWAPDYFRGLYARINCGKPVEEDF